MRAWGLRGAEEHAALGHVVKRVTHLLVDEELAAVEAHSRHRRRRDMHGMRPDAQAGRDVSLASFNQQINRQGWGAGEDGLSPVSR